MCSIANIHVFIGGDYPWYVFRGHPVPVKSESNDSTVPYKICPTPKVIYDAVKRFYPREIDDVSYSKSRELFVNAQWALGGEGTGAPVSSYLIAVIICLNRPTATV